MDLCIIVRKAVLTVRGCSGFSCSTTVEFIDVWVRVSAREGSQSWRSWTCPRHVSTELFLSSQWKQFVFFSATVMLCTPPGCLSGRKYSFHLSGKISLWFFLPKLLLHVLHNPCLCKNLDSMKNTQFFSYLSEFVPQAHKGSVISTQRLS